MKSKQFHSAGLLAVFLVLLAICKSHADLPPDAQNAVNKGINAAKQQDYLQAVSFFQDARNIAPDAPEIYFNLGLAESKIPSRELRAICWFEAYLTANPNASNAATVNSQIDALDIKSKTNLSQVIQLLQDTASKMGDNDIRDNNLSLVAELWAEASDMTAAMKTVNIIQSPLYKSEALHNVFIRQIQTHDFAGALKTVDLMQPSPGTLASEFTNAIASEKAMVAQAQAETSSANHVITVSDWRSKLGYNVQGALIKGFGLNEEIFLDLPDYLTVKHSDDPQKLFDTLKDTAGEIIEMQNIIDQMLKQLQTKP